MKNLCLFYKLIKWRKKKDHFFLLVSIIGIFSSWFTFLLPLFYLWVYVHACIFVFNLYSWVARILGVVIWDGVRIELMICFTYILTIFKELACNLWEQKCYINIYFKWEAACIENANIFLCCMESSSQFLH